MTTERERRLDALREEAARHGTVAGAEGPASPIAGGPMPPAPMASYHGQPVLKAPVWTWEVPAYFVVGGIAGMSAVIATAASIGGADGALARDARLVALVGALTSPLLLIADLGRPSRFLNMLRVFKRQSAMSIGAWSLVVFSAAIGLATIMHETGAASPAPWLVTPADVAAALTGLVLVTYPGVLLGVSAVPVWAAHAHRLPYLFAASSLGAAISVVELAGHRTAAANAIGLAAAAAELAASGWIVTSRARDQLPPRSSGAGRLLIGADVLGGVLPLVLRSVAAASPPARTVAAVSTIAGAVCLRYGWIAAGRVSTSDPAAALGSKAASR